MINQNIVQSADKGKTTYASPKTLRENRAIEKQAISQKNNIMGHIETELKEENVNQLRLESVSEETIVEKVPVEDFLSALDLFED